MRNKWIITDHHIAIRNGNTIFHPNASEIFDCMSGDGFDCHFSNPTEELDNIRFSKVGSAIRCKITSNDKNEIIINLYVIRKNKECLVDAVRGAVIDHALSNNEWFYINGDVDRINELFHNAGIQSCGQISIGQYIELLREEYFSGRKVIEIDVRNEIVIDILNREQNLPLGIKASLYNYQKIGFSWIKSMLNAVHGCILGDEMGLGKTLQIITLMQDNKEHNNKPSLVIAPVSLIVNWKRECEKFAPDLKVLIHHGANRTGIYKDLLHYDIVVISYNTAVTDLGMLKMINWYCVVIDEAQNIKNPSSERAQAVKALIRRNSVAVTGTPFENHITDLWSIMDFAIPGLFGSLNTFKQAVTDDVLGAEKIEPILTPVMIRRLVKDVATDLPEKIIIPQALEMTDYEKELYNDLRHDAVEKSQDKKVIPLGTIQKLRMFCTHPFLCKFTPGFNPERYSMKYTRFCEIVQEIVSRNEKVIVFTSYKRMFDIIASDIPERYGIEVSCINGETPVENRQSIVDWFNKYDGSAMLVLNPRAAGTGLNITGANHVIHYNLEWNPALEDQASARAYRRGQAKTVFIYRLFYLDTVEEVINERIDRKRKTSSAAVIGINGEDSDQRDILKALELAPAIKEEGRYDQNRIS